MRSKIVVFLLLLLIVLLQCGRTSSPIPLCTSITRQFASWPVPYHLAFLSRERQNKDWEIYLLVDPTRPPINLTESPGDDGYVQGIENITWSPNGKLLAFVSERNLIQAIHILNLAEYSPRPLLVRIHASDFYWPFYLAWSPLGDRIAFVAEEVEDEALALYVVNTDGSSLQKIYTPNVQGRSWPVFPSWSPEGTGIAFYLVQGDGGVGIVQVDKTRQVLLSSETVSDFEPVNWRPWHEVTRDMLPSVRAPSWSPDGSSLAFAAWTGWIDGGDMLFITDRDGHALRKLGEGNAPEWSPVRDQIVFVRGGQIYVVEATGKNERQLTFEGENGTPRWSPDGCYIAFTSNRDGDWEIYVMNADGSSQTNVSNRPNTDDVYPLWRSLGP